MSDKCDEKDESITALQLKIKDFKKQLEVSGFGASKNTSELELLRKNVTEMESIMKTKDFEIKKLRSRSTKSIGDVTNSLSNPEDLETIQSLQSELEKLKQKMEKLNSRYVEMKQELEKVTLEKESMESLLNKKKCRVSAFENRNKYI